MNKNILIVDDEHDILHLFSEELKSAGYKTFTASNSKDCYSILDSSDVDLCLLDIKLKDENGIDILHHISNSYPSVLTMMCTAYSAFQDDVSTWKADGYWVKSQDLDSLKEEVARVFDKKKKADIS